MGAQVFSLLCFLVIFRAAIGASTVSSKWKYIGCYKDARPRDLTSYHKYTSTVSGMSLEKCYEFCKGYNTKYMALQDGNTCRCDNNYGRYGKASESDCDEPCTKSTRQTCGGGFRNSVYQVSTVPTTTIDSTMMKLTASQQLSFIAVGDWGSTGSHQSNVAKQMSNWASNNNAKFTMALGDNFYNTGVTGTTDRKWQSTWRDVYLRYSSLKHPWLAIEGNHDYMLGNARHQVRYGQKSSTWVMPSLYYSMKYYIDGKQVHFIFLDTEPIKNSNSDYHQIKWFQREIATSKADWLFVIGHHPVFSSGTHGSSSSTKVMYDEIRPYLEKYKAAFYICGHDHFLEHIQYRSIDYVLSGGGAKRRSTSSKGTGNIKSKGATSKFMKSEYGFIGVTIKGSTATVSFIDEDGKKIYSITKQNPRDGRSDFGK